MRAPSPFSVDAAFTDSVAALEWVEQRALTSIASPSSDWTARVGYLQRRRSAGASRGDAYVRWRTSLLGERYARKRGAVEERLFTSYAEKQLLAAQAAEYAARHEHSLELESPSSSSSPPPPRGAPNASCVNILSSPGISSSLSLSLSLSLSSPVDGRGGTVPAGVRLGMLPSLSLSLFAAGAFAAAPVALAALAALARSRFFRRFAAFFMRFRSAVFSRSARISSSFARSRSCIASRSRSSSRLRALRSFVFRESKMLGERVKL